MIKKHFTDEPLKVQYRKRAQDRLYRFVLADGRLRGAVLNGTWMIREMRANHELGILETVALGRAYLGAGLMAADLKGQERISLNIDCSGPIKGLAVESNAFGEVRGFLKNRQLPVGQPLESFDLSPFFGAGLLGVTRHLENAKQPFCGKIALEYGNIAKDLANYYLVSEQVPAAFHLSIQFDPEGEVIGAGGLLLQAAPDAAEDLVAQIEAKVRDFPSLGRLCARGRSPDSVVGHVFSAFRPQIVSARRVEFMCHCSKARTRDLLTLLPVTELEDILARGPFPLEMRCHHCNTAYYFDRAEIRRIYGRRYPHN
jgi:molecular chaperone Hsp33